jgi:ribonuclease HI
MSGKDPSLDPASSSYTAKFYGVRSGKVPGVYTDWASAEMQVKGVQKPKVKYVLGSQLCMIRRDGC